MKKELNYCLKRQSGGSGFFCNFSIAIEPKSDLTHHQVEDISIDDYGNKLFRDDWFYAVIGINYALERFTSETFYDIKITKCTIFHVDYFPLIIVYAASRVLLNHFENDETKNELQQIENELFTKRNNGFNGFYAFKNRSKLIQKPLVQKQKIIQNWQPYDWHSDYLNFNTEFKVLQTISRYLLPIFPNCDFRLNSFEEGYQLVEIYKNGEQWAEMQVADIDKETVIFDSLEFEEIYISLSFFS